MMNQTIFQSTVAGLFLSTSMVSGFAADNVAVEKAWKVEITPARSSERSDQLPRKPSESGSGKLSPLPNRHSIIIQPVSYLQGGDESPVQQAAPVPAEVIEQRKAEEVVQPVTAPAPIPALNPQPIHPHPTSHLPVIIPKRSDESTITPVIHPQAALYRDIYYSIPFRRAEFNANPSYRHEATMELLFNQMRPTTIQRSTTNVFHYGAGGGYGYWLGDPPYYPYSYGLRIHHTR